MEEFIESEIIFYAGNEGQRKIDVFFQNESS